MVLPLCLLVLTFCVMLWLLRDSTLSPLLRPRLACNSSQNELQGFHLATAKSSLSIPICTRGSCRALLYHVGDSRNIGQQSVGGPQASEKVETDWACSTEDRPTRQHVTPRAVHQGSCRKDKLMRSTSQKRADHSVPMAARVSEHGTVCVSAVTPTHHLRSHLVYPAEVIQVAPKD